MCVRGRRLQLPIGLCLSARDLPRWQLHGSLSLGHARPGPPGTSHTVSDLGQREWKRRVREAPCVVQAGYGAATARNKETAESTPAPQIFRLGIGPEREL